MATDKNDDDKLIPHTLTRGGVALIKQALSQSGWYEGSEGTAHLCAAGDLLSEELTEKRFAPPVAPDHIRYATREKQAPPQDIEAFQKIFDEWNDGEEILNISDAKREAIKASMAHFLKKALFPPSKHLNSVIRQFGLKK